MLTVNAPLVARAQNEEEMRRLSVAGHAQDEELKRISAWAAILFALTVVGGIYGMNFDHIPELHWAAGYPLALTLMVAVSLGLFLAFKRRGWL
jgi:magnesium transporter